MGSHLDTNLLRCHVLINFEAFHEVWLRHSRLQVLGAAATRPA